MTGLFDNLTKNIKGIIKDTIRKEYPAMALFEVTDISSKDSNDKADKYMINIKHPNSSLAYNDVPILGLGLGNLKGIITLPKKGDFVVVGWLGSEPVVLGTIFDYFTQSPDTIPKIKIDELLITNKEQGPTIFIDADNNIIMKTPSGARLKLGNDDTLKILDSNGYGIVVTSGDVKIYSNNVETADKGVGTVKVPLTYNTTTTW